MVFYAFGKEVGYPGLHAGRRIHDRVGEMMREEVGIVWVRVTGGGNREIARLAWGRSNRWDVWGGVCCVGCGHGESVGIRTLGGGGARCTLGGGGAVRTLGSGGAVGTLGSGGAVCTLGRGGAGKPGCWLVGGCAGSAKCIILAN